MVKVSSTRGVDHVLLLKVKQGSTEADMQKFTDGVYSLKSIEGVEAVVAGRILIEPWLQNRLEGFTHYIRIRLESRTSLKNYQSDHLHVQVRDGCIKPILEAPPLAVDCDDDLWFAENITHEPSEGVDYVMLLKLKPSLEDNQIIELKEGVRSLTTLPGVVSSMVGSIFIEDWLPDRRQGFTHYIRIRLQSLEALQALQLQKLHIRVNNQCIAPLLASPTLVLQCDAPAEI